ncbi:GntR family transcriptional regulator [Rhodococcus oryzae]|uniref:GntR family transcriptional regulator n=1 Tax=Rhodococcus oryzae TaxID=2571143 RepID=A0ABY2RMB1_9NOCA|nr:GntR family transcriptional regulator [Rhodococcus oryzae]TJZ79429.1 GntR family transcriptional regulator [Rhodococcus oryzae]
MAARSRARQEHSHLGEQVYRALRDDLVCGRFSPLDRLGEERLAELYGVSRTPVREALARLLSEELVAREDGGLFPYRPRFEDLHGLYELRMTVELRGIDRVIEDRRLEHAQDILRAELERWIRMRAEPPTPGPDFIASDEAFHTALLRASGNHALSEALDSVHSKLRPVRRLDPWTPERVRATIDSHLKIVRGLLAGDLGPAAGELHLHLLRSRDLVVERTGQAVASSAMARAIRE